jgi:hypothetical protein
MFVPEDIVNKFQKIGAAVQIRMREPRRALTIVERRMERIDPVPITIDVISFDGREIFDIGIDRNFKDRLDLQVPQLLPEDAHLVLVARELDRIGQVLNRHHFLCGHDERHWFVAGLPRVSTVREAKSALKPEVVRWQESRIGLKSKRANRRRNQAFIRQGEWFFIPTPDLSVDAKYVLEYEPIRGGGRRQGKPHWPQFAYRTGGENVKVCHRFPNGLTLNEYDTLIRSDPKASKYYWSDMRRNPTLYAKGRITHPDHATVVLPNWHRVLLNAERRTETVAFLD